MALEISSLTELNTAEVDAMFATFTQLMQERHPDVELTRGVFHDLVLYFNSVLNASVRANIARVLASNSLLTIATDPALADPSLVDRVLSNYNLTRDAGAASTGEATIVLSLPIQTAISEGITFTADSLVFQPTQSFVALPPGSAAVNANERVMLAVGDGTYVVNILMQATTVGIVGNIRRGTKLVPDSLINNTVAAFAASDFVNGANPPTNAEYISKLPTGLAAKTIGGRQNFVAALRDQAAFKNIPHFSILGCGDPEQQRDQHTRQPDHQEHQLPRRQHADPRDRHIPHAFSQFDDLAADDQRQPRPEVRPHRVGADGAGTPLGREVIRYQRIGGR